MNDQEYQNNQTQNIDFQQSNNFQNINKNHNKIKTFENELQQLQQKLLNLIILPFQSQKTNNPSKQTIYRLSKQLSYSLQQNLKDIKSLQNKLQIPTLNNQQKQQIKQKILQLTMQQLANNRVLVQTYQHHQYRIIIAIFHISKIYQQLNCHEQVINHLTNALQMNQSYLDIKEAFYFHSLILTYLANSLCELQNYQASLENLNKALQIHEQLMADNIDVNDFFTLHLISKVLSVLKKDQQAITYGKMALQSAQKNYTQNSYQYSKALRNLADVSAKAGLFNQSIQYLNQAIQTIQIHAPQKQQIIIQFYTKLTQITLNKLNLNSSSNPQHFQPYIDILIKRYNVIENIYGYRDKRAIKEKRHLASSYLKYNKIQQAENQLEDILEIQSLVYGEKSVEVAKTLKLLGTVAMSLNSIKKAEKYLKKSQGIFHDQGFTNLQKQVTSKLLIITAESKQRFNHK